MKKKYRKNLKLATEVFESYERFQLTISFDTSWVFRALTIAFLRGKYLKPTKKEEKLMRTHREVIAFKKYFKRIFGWRCRDDQFIENSPPYQFLFGPNWVNYDTTARGVIRRIRYYLKNEKK